MSYKVKLEQTLQKIIDQKTEADSKLKNLEEDFGNVKLNPYGVTSVDFSKRQELSSDILKMEGVIMGLTLALETYGESEGVTA